uniref:UBC core domain-containing protein n=1 Tax=Panagrolaimus sp. PS1159 TaxID=55785 RepID=A0AC35FHZ2_9BILA
MQRTQRLLLVKKKNESSRQRILAFVTGSKQVVISTGRLFLTSVMGSSLSTSSSPEPHDDIESLAERLNSLIEQKPWRMSDMLKVIGILGESTPDEKLLLYNAGVVDKLCRLIRENNNSEAVIPRATTASTKRKRQTSQPQPRPADTKAADAAANRGIGYGRGSTKSQWDIERTVEERIAQEEHLMWLLCALNTYLWGDSLKLSEVNASVLAGRQAVHLVDGLLPTILDTAIFSLLEYHLNNDSIFDVSQHLDFYQSLIELTAGLSLIPSFLPYLVAPKDPESKSIAKELIPKFRDALNSYMNNTKLPISPDFTLIDFIQRINDLTELVLHCARRYESELPPEKRVKTADPRQRCLSPPPTASSVASANLSQEELYKKLLEKLQMGSTRLIDDNNQPIYSTNFKKEIKSINPVAASNRERNRRIAKELASMTSSLPLSLSSSIFVVMDETRCDVLKVLITGPEDTPYSNGIFEFDVFFPNNYPNVPPKCLLTTTGGGTVRFNPNLYADGKVCLSLLGTWEGRNEEKWNPLCSCLQVLVSIQALILVKHPYFNEPGFERHQGTARGDESSRKYNFNIEQANLIHALYGQFKNPPVYFKDVIMRHFWIKRDDIIKQAEKWLMNSSLNSANRGGSGSDADFDAGIPQNNLIQELLLMTDPTESATVPPAADASSTLTV